MAKPPTVYDVAARAEVSIATVSRVLTSPDTVKASTRERVFAAVAELGYVPSASARGLAARRTKVIGLFLPGRADELPPVSVGHGEVPVVTDDGDEPENESLYYDEVLRGAELEASRRGYALMIASGAGSIGDLAGRVDGMAVLAGAVPHDVLTSVARRIPIAILGGSGDADEFDHVHANNGPGMRALAEHLVARGVTDFVYLAGPEGTPDDGERFAGFSQVTSSARVEVLRSDFTRSGGRQAAQGIIHMPQAIVCANDQMALGVLDVLAARGIRVPEEVLVTGFDGISAGRHSQPSLTTVHQPMADLGRAAIDAITSRILAPDAPRQQLTLQVRVVLRESSP